MAANIVFLIVLLLLIAALLNEPSLFMPMALLASALIFGRVWGKRALKNVRVRRMMADRSFANDKVRVTIELENTGRLPVVWLRLHDSLPAELAPHQFDHAISLKGGERQQFEYVIQTNRRGYYQVGPLSAQSGDVLGLSDSSMVHAAGMTPLLVYPRVVPFKWLFVPSTMPLGDVRQRQPLFEDPNRVRGKRDYIRGDSLRRVDWKATAATGHLQVKMFESSVTLSTMIVLDLSVGAYDHMTQLDSVELAIVIAASVANHMVTMRQSVGLVTNGLSPMGKPAMFPPRKGRAHLIQLLESLAGVKAVEADPAATLVNHERGRLAWGTTLVIVTGKADDVLFEALMHTRRTGLNPVLILCGRGVNLPPAQRRAAVCGIPLQYVRTENDVRELTF